MFKVIAMTGGVSAKPSATSPIDFRSQALSAMRLSCNSPPDIEPETRE
jgi:hypothetical protein